LTKSKCAGNINHFVTKNDHYVDQCQQLTANVKPEVEAEQGLTSPQTHCRSYRGEVLRVK